MTGAPFLTTTVANQRVAVEIALGADLTDLTGASWTWTDITADVILEDGKGISINLGRPDSSQQTQAAEMTCELDNRDGDYSHGGLSVNWPYIRRNTPVRVRVSTNGGTDWYVRFQGRATGFTPQWDPDTGRWATVTLSASGPLRQLNQGTLSSKSVYATEIPTSSAWNGLIMYWPCEGGDDIQDNYARVPTSGHPTLKLLSAYYPKVTNNPSTSAFPLSGPLQSSFAMEIDPEAIPSYTNTGILQVRMIVAVPQAFPVAQWQPLFYIYTTNATVPALSLQLNEAGNLRVVGLNSSSSIIRTGAAVAFDMNGSARLVQVTFDNNGSGLDIEVSTLDQLGTPAYWDETFASTNIGVLTDATFVGPDLSEGGDGTVNVIVGHASIQNAVTDIATAESIFVDGLRGETTTARLTRLCNNHDLPLTVLTSTVAENASITDTMGPQYYDTLTNLLRECETTGQGVLYDGLNIGLTYCTKRYREAAANGPAALTLDASAAQIMEPWQPVDDDQLTINHAEVSKRNGAVVPYGDVTGPSGTDAIGAYSTSFQVNSNSDVGLERYAQWAVNVGTKQGYRYPSVSFALETNPGLIAGWLACTPQSRVDVTNITAVRRQHPAETIKMMLEGWQEDIDAFTWRVTANTSSAEPWNVALQAAATGSTGDGVGRLDTVSSQLNTSAAAGATSISVKTNSGNRWITNAEDSDSFPFDISVGGLKATVTAVSGTSSPQTFTLSAGLPRALTGSTTVGAGVPISLWRPPVFGL